MKITTILPCAGTGSRAGFSENKLLKKINGITVFEKTYKAFAGLDLIGEIIVACSETDEKIFKEIISKHNKKTVFVRGGGNRTQSVKNALLSVSNCDIVLIHDGARPFVSEEIIKNCIESVKSRGSGICAVPCTDTVYCKKDNKITETLSRESLVNIQTPQGFEFKLIKKAYLQIKDNDNFTDDAGVYLKYIGQPRLCAGDIKNIKLTYKEDFMSNEFLTGTGTDAHRFEKGGKLILGGVEIPFTHGLLGHSDADALVHAIMDALLSACGFKDIGYYFPPSDDKYKGISSLTLLKNVYGMISKDFAIIKVSAVICCEKPKLLNYIPLMCKNISEVLNLDINRVNVSATTFEGMGFVGRSEGILCNAVATVRS